MQVLILGALPQEIALCRSLLADRRDEKWMDVEVSRGGIGSLSATVAASGVGKTNAAMAAQHFVEALAPDAMIFCGVAGAVNPDLEIGDIVVAQDCVQYDLDATAVGFALGEVPFSGRRFLASDSSMVLAALSHRPEGYAIRAGRVLTGDRVVTDASGEAFARIRAELGGDVVEMEGASAALVADRNGVPFLLVRAVSDRADHSAATDFSAFLPIGAARLRDLIAHMARVWPRGVDNRGASR